MAADGKVPVLESVQAGWAFMRKALPTVAPAGLLAAVVYTLLQVTATMGNDASPFELVLALASMAMSVAFSAFTFRLALRQDASGFYGLKFGKDEANLFGTFVIVGFFFLIVATPCILALAGAIGVAATRAKINFTETQNDPAASAAAFQTILTGPDAPVIFIVFFAAVALLLWLSARLVLISVATIAEERIMAFSTWEWTRGNAWRILAATFIVAAPLAIGSAAVVLLIGAGARLARRRHRPLRRAGRDEIPLGHRPIFDRHAGRKRVIGASLSRLASAELGAAAGKGGLRSTAHASVCSLGVLLACSLFAESG